MSMDEILEEIEKFKESIGKSIKNFLEGILVFDEEEEEEEEETTEEEEEEEEEEKPKKKKKTKTKKKKTKKKEESGDWTEKDIPPDEW